MHPALAVRRIARNTALAAVSAPSTFVVIASRIVSDDQLEVALRGEHEGTLDQAKRHAVKLAQAVAARYGCPACAEVVANGLPVFFASTAGGAS